MSRARIAGAVVAVAIIVFVGGFAIFATQHNLLASGTYYTRVDNACVEENESTGGVVHFESNEPFIYTLPAFDAAGKEIEVSFGASRVLREDAYLRLELAPIRGVVSWEEVDSGDLPGVNRP